MAFPYPGALASGSLATLPWHQPGRCRIPDCRLRRLPASLAGVSVSAYAGQERKSGL